MTFTPANGGMQTIYVLAYVSGEKITWKVYDFKGPGVGLGMYNTDEVSITSNEC